MADTATVHSLDEMLDWLRRAVAPDAVIYHVGRLSVARLRDPDVDERAALARICADRGAATLYQLRVWAEVSAAVIQRGPSWTSVPAALLAGDLLPSDWATLDLVAKRDLFRTSWQRVVSRQRGITETAAEASLLRLASGGFVIRDTGGFVDLSSAGVAALRRDSPPRASRRRRAAACRIVAPDPSDP